jgi:hypothetical protein
MGEPEVNRDDHFVCPWLPGVDDGRYRLAVYTRFGAGLAVVSEAGRPGHYLGEDGWREALRQLELDGLAELGAAIAAGTIARDDADTPLLSVTAASPPAQGAPYSPGLRGANGASKAPSHGKGGAGGRRAAPAALPPQHLGAARCQRARLVCET